MPANLKKVIQALNNCTKEVPECINVDNYIEKEIFIHYQMVLGQISKVLVEKELSNQVLKNICNNVDTLILEMIDLDMLKASLIIAILADIVIELEELLVEYEEFEAAVNFRNLNDFKNKNFIIKK